MVGDDSRGYLREVVVVLDGLRWSTLINLDYDLPTADGDEWEGSEA